jgi:hypothetical protein
MECEHGANGAFDLLRHVEHFGERHCGARRRAARDPAPDRCRLGVGFFGSAADLPLDSPRAVADACIWLISGWECIRAGVRPGLQNRNRGHAATVPSADGLSEVPMNPGGSRRIAHDTVGGN